MSKQESEQKVVFLVAPWITSYEELEEIGRFLESNLPTEFKKRIRLIIMNKAEMLSKDELAKYLERLLELVAKK